MSHFEDLIERVLEGEVISVTEIKVDYDGTVIKFWRFGDSQQTEIFFNGKKRNEIDEYFQKI